MLYKRGGYGIMPTDIIPRRSGSDRREENTRPGRVHPPEGYHVGRTWYNRVKDYTWPARRPRGDVVDGSDGMGIIERR